MGKLEIGQELYRWASPYIMKYIVTGLRSYSDSEQYEVECQSCKHGYLCKVLIARDDYGKLRTVNMLNDDDGSQKCWHAGRDEMSGSYCLTQEDAQRERAYWSLEQAKKKIEQTKANHDSAVAHYEEIKNVIDLLGKETPNDR